MTWQEARRIALSALGIDILVATVCLGICAVFFSVSSLAVGTAMLAATILLVFVGGGAGGSIQPLRVPHFETHSHARMPLPDQSEALMHHRQPNLQRTMNQLRGLSWTMVFLLAAVPLFAAAIILIMWES